MTIPFQADPPGPPTVRAPPPHVPRPGRSPRVAGLVLLVVGAIGGLLTVAGFVETQRAVRDFHRVPALGGPVLIDHPGTYVIYYEPGGGLIANLMSPRSQGAEVRTVHAIGPDGNAATVTSTPGMTSYSCEGHSGYRIAEMTADRPGPYKIQTEARSAPHDTLAVGGSIRCLLAIVFFGGLFAIPVALAGLLLLLIGDALRRAHCSSAQLVP